MALILFVVLVLISWRIATDDGVEAASPSELGPASAPSVTVQAVS